MSLLIYVFGVRGCLASTLPPFSVGVSLVGSYIITERKFFPLLGCFKKFPTVVREEMWSFFFISLRQRFLVATTVPFSLDVSFVPF